LSLSATDDTSFRRTWDKQEYEQYAQDRARRKQRLEEEEERKPRTEKVVLDANLNRTQLVQSTSIASKQLGYYCKVCDCVVNDSVNYLDHINGKKRDENRNMKDWFMTILKFLFPFHKVQRALGRIMKVERSTLDQ
ncbi:7084_t:CDS:2, partial [Ambispora gerdemannii]